MTQPSGRTDITSTDIAWLNSQLTTARLDVVYAKEDADLAETHEYIKALERWLDELNHHPVTHAQPMLQPSGREILVDLIYGTPKILPEVELKLFDAICSEVIGEDIEYEPIRQRLRIFFNQPEAAPPQPEKEQG